LLAIVNIVAGEELDEAAELLKQALKLFACAPGANR
jgi:hypothetical protein